MLFSADDDVASDGGIFSAIDRVPRDGVRTVWACLWSLLGRGEFGIAAVTAGVVLPTIAAVPAGHTDIATKTVRLEARAFLAKIWG